MHVYIWEEGAYEYIYNAYLHVCGHLYAYLHKEGNECVEVCMHICHEHGDQKLMLEI